MLKSSNTIEKYYEYRDKIVNRKEIYRIVAKRYGVASTLYLGSHIDIVLSLVIPKVIYIDNFKGGINFFRNMANKESINMEPVVYPKIKVTKKKKHYSKLIINNDE